MFYTDVALLYYTYPFVTLIAYLPVYTTETLWILIINIIALASFILFAFYSVGFRSIPSLLIGLIGGILTLPVLGAFQIIGIVLNGILNILPWEIINVKHLLQNGTCDLQVKLPEKSADLL